jgi:hypothetical protein
LESFVGLFRAPERSPADQQRSENLWGIGDQESHVAKLGSNSRVSDGFDPLGWFIQLPSDWDSNGLACVPIDDLFPKDFAYVDLPPSFEVTLDIIELISDSAGVGFTDREGPGPSTSESEQTRFTQAGVFPVPSQFGFKLRGRSH